MTKSLAKKYFENFIKILQKTSDEELIKDFNKEVDLKGNGWTTARASFLAAIHHEFNRRGFDYSEIGNKKELSFKNHIVLKEKKITIANT